jgi:hypothetical protein
LQPCKISILLDRVQGEYAKMKIIDGWENQGGFLCHLTIFFVNVVEILLPQQSKF